MHHVLEAPDEHVHPHEHHPEHGEPGACDEELGHGEVRAARGGERVALVVVEAGESGAPDRRHVVLEGAREGDGVMIRQTREALHVFRRWTRGEVRGPVDTLFTSERCASLFSAAIVQSTPPPPAPSKVGGRTKPCEIFPSQRAAGARWKNS